MKTFLIVFVMVTFSVAANSQFGFTLSKLAGEPMIFDLDIATSGRGVMVSEDDDVFVTFDAGQTWSDRSAQFSGQQFRGVCQISNDVAMIVGVDGVVFKTVNGGTSWIPLSSGSTSKLWRVDFSSETNGVIVGNEGLILRTTDGGNTWVEKSSHTSVELMDVRFRDQNYAIAVGRNGTILRSTNRGEDWTVLTSGIWTQDLFAVDFAGTRICAVGDRGCILRSTISDDLFMDYGSNNSKESFNDIAFINASVGYVAGGIETPIFYGLILKTTDGGRTFESYQSPTESGLFAVECIGEERVIVAGWFGAMYTIGFQDDISVGVVREDPEPPYRFGVVGNYPNPAADVVTLNINVAEPGIAHIQVFDQAHRIVTSVSEYFSFVGIHKKAIETSNLAQGVYTWCVSMNGENKCSNIVICR